MPARDPPGDGEAMDVVATASEMDSIAEGTLAAVQQGVSAENSADADLPHARSHLSDWREEEEMRLATELSIRESQVAAGGRSAARMRALDPDPRLG